MSEFSTRLHSAFATTIPKWLSRCAAAPASPVLLAISIELAKKVGKPDELPPARARLMALARTPAERALAAE